MAYTSLSSPRVDNRCEYIAPLYAIVHVSGMPDG
ncbi:hypothetical protein HNQ50_003432 [Silvimonas terrae]|uniref:Uncharacterized protein n=1 Tax=Silvimonas terrae TaxID=300266 RepID=A0A840RJJ5_9NEIS|nr:hypothetical protein [Silvimonas terrae]